MAKHPAATSPLCTHAHLVGIGGVGMTGLALILDDLGVKVTGSDAADSSNLASLRRRGLDVRIGHLPAAGRGADLLIYSSAVPPDNPERRAATTRGVRQSRRGEFLAELARRYPLRVAVAGSHGKTTVSAMLAHVFLHHGRCPGYLVGGNVPTLPTPAAAGDGGLIVSEVDESDGTQALFAATHAVVTNVDDDHCWSLGGEAALRQCFREFAARAEHLITWDEPGLRELFGDHRDALFLAPREVTGLAEALPVAGSHNRLNAALAVAAASCLGIPRHTAIRLLAGFRGVDRRLSCRYRDEDVAVVEDYAHHPTEVAASLSAVREQFPGHRLRVVFQPHRYARVARYRNAFAERLSAADDVVITPPFDAWVGDTDLADPRDIVRRIRGCSARYSTAPFETLAHELVRTLARPEVMVIMGAGDIHGLIPELKACLTGARGPHRSAEIPG